MPRDDLKLKVRALVRKSQGDFVHNHIQAKYRPSSLIVVAIMLLGSVLAQPAQGAETAGSKCTTLGVATIFTA